MIRRSCKLSQTNSFFLFGPRGVGKTTLISEVFAGRNPCLVDLLDSEVWDQLTLDPSRFKQMIDEPRYINSPVIIDEVQKLPKLLDVAHSQIQKRKRQFILTGSSSRKLMQKSSNMLAGRAWVYRLFPFSTLELETLFDLKKALELGGLPEAYMATTKEDANRYLRAYLLTYIEKKIQQEQWVKKMEPFRRFLAVAAQMNGKIVNKSALAIEAGVDDSTVANYFEILEQTLIGFSLPAYHTSVRKAQRLGFKFYFIDTGLKRAIDKTLTVELLPQTYAWGDAFEHWLILEFYKNISYRELDWSLSFARTKNDVEIDLIIDRPGKKRLMVEIKSKNRVSEKDAKSLETFGADLDPEAEKWLLSCDELEQRFGSTRAIHWRNAITELFS